MTKPTFVPPNRWIMRDLPELGLTISRVVLAAFDHCYPNGYEVTYSQLADDIGCDFKTVAAALDVAAEVGILTREEARNHRGRVSGVFIRFIATAKPEKMPSKADIKAMYSRFLALRKRSTSANPFAPEVPRGQSGEPIPETTGVVSGARVPETTGVHILKPPGSRPETTGVASLSSPVGQVVHPPLADERTDRTEDGHAREARSPSSSATRRGATPTPPKWDQATQADRTTFADVLSIRRNQADVTTPELVEAFDRECGGRDPGEFVADVRARVLADIAERRPGLDPDVLGSLATLAMRAAMRARGYVIPECEDCDDEAEAVDTRTVSDTWDPVRRYADNQPF